MSQSLGKRNFSKSGLTAMCIYEQLLHEALQKNALLGKRGVESLSTIVNEAKRLAATSELLQLPRTELEAMAAAAKGRYSSWGSYATFSSRQFIG